MWYFLVFHVLMVRELGLQNIYIDKALVASFVFFFTD